MQSRQMIFGNLSSSDIWKWKARLSQVKPQPLSDAKFVPSTEGIRESSEVYRWAAPRPRKPLCPASDIWTRTDDTNSKTLRPFRPIMNQRKIETRFRLPDGRTSGLNMLYWARLNSGIFTVQIQIDFTDFTDLIQFAIWQNLDICKYRMQRRSKQNNQS